MIPLPTWWDSAHHKNVAAEREEYINQSLRVHADDVVKESILAHMKNSRLTHDSTVLDFMQSVYTMETSSSACTKPAGSRFRSTLVEVHV